MPPRTSRNSGRGASQPTQRGGRTRGRAAASDEEHAENVEVKREPGVEDNSQSSATAEPSSDAPAQETATTEQDSSSRGAAASGLKFRPRAVRRSEAERQRITQEQEKIQNKKLADDARQKARANRLRGRGRGRGRGSIVTRGAIHSTTAAGPLSLGFGSSAKYGTASSSQQNAQGSGGARSSAASGSKAIERSGESDSSPYGVLFDDVDDTRINADLLYGHMEHSSDDDGGRQLVKGSRRKKPLMPMGIPRNEYKEEGITMASTAEIQAQEQGENAGSDTDSEEMWVDEAEVQRGDNTEISKDEGVWEHAAPRTRGAVKIKNQQGVEVETMDIDEIAGSRILGKGKKPESPEQKKALLQGSKGPIRKSRKRKAAPKDPEDELLSQDLEHLVELLGIHSKEAQGGSLGAHSGNELEGHMFLFQFPPVLPQLAPMASEDQPDPIKTEPDGDVVLLDQPENRTTANIDLTKQVDEEEGEDEDRDDEEAETLKEGGFVGKLVMRKSGKVELNWGGQVLELVPGNQIQFLTTAALVEQADIKVKEEELAPAAGLEIAGTAYGMGKIEGKFVLAPTWGEEEEWNVDPRDLEVDMA